MDEINALHDFAQSIKDLFLTLAVCSLRMYAAFSILPPMNDEFLPGGARNALVVMMGFYIAFGMPPADVASLDAMQWFGLAMKETLIGLLLGFGAATVFWAAESIGALIDMQAGYNSVQLQNPMSGQQSTPVSSLLLQMTVAVFYVLGGMLIFIGALLDSYQVWPVLSAMPSLHGITEVLFLDQVDNLMTTITKFAVPVLLVLVLIDLGIGIITRAADKLEPTSLAQPIKGAVTMLMLALLAGILITQVRQYLLPTDVLQKVLPLLGK